MASICGSALKVSRSSSEKSPANALTESHQWVIFDVDDMVPEKVLIFMVSEVASTCLRVTMYLLGIGFCALVIRKRGGGAARVGRTKRARATSLEQIITKELVAGDHRKKRVNTGDQMSKRIVWGMEEGLSGPASIFMRGCALAPPYDTSR